MINLPKVSVILTSFNHAKYLHESIDSVLNQTFNNFELIIWDDASTDGSWEIINSYSDPRLRSYRSKTPNIIGHLREVISDTAIGEYIAIHHSDDVWEPDKLEKQVAFLDANPEKGAVFTWAQIIDEDGQQLQDVNHFYYKVFDQPNRTRYEWLNYFFYNGNALCHPSVLIRKSCYSEAGLYRYGLAQLPDFDMWVRLCMKYDIHVIAEKLVRFRIRSNEANTSGIRPETQVRWRFEFLQVLENFKSISTVDELVRIFPHAENYVTPQGYDLEYALAMIALENNLNPPVELFGLNILFEIFKDPVRMQTIKNIYNFGQSDFIALTAKHDVFSVELVDHKAQIASLNSQIAHLDAQSTSLRAQLDSVTTTLSAVTQSKGWRLLEPLRWLRLQQIRVQPLLKMILLLFIQPRDTLALFRGALNVWRREGWAGVKSASQFYINYYIKKSTTGGNTSNNSLYHYLRASKTNLFQDTNRTMATYAPKVSVIVPNFNHGAYLEERLNSIYEQTYQNFEVILLDDCSVDDSPSILKKYATKYADKTRCYFNEVNSGSPFSQWEKGILLAEGDLIWIAESDDFCEKNFLEKLVPLFSNDAILLSYARPVFIDEKGNQHIFAFENYVRQINHKKWSTSYIETAHNEVNTALALLNTIPNVSGVLFRRLDSHFSLFSDPEWKKMRVCGDWLFYLHLIRGGAIAYNCDTRNYYRIYEDSTSKKTHSQDVYYQEHERVALAVASLYKVPSDLLYRLQARLKDFYFKNVVDGSAKKFDALFNINKITQNISVRKPNVLMATYGLVTGGGEIYPIRLANALQKAGTTVTLFNGNYEPAQPGVRKMLSPQIAIITRTADLSLNELLVNFGIEVIHSHHASMEDYFAVNRAITTTKVKHIATLHGMYEMMNDFDFLYNTKNIRRSVDHWIYTADKNILPFKKNSLFSADKFTKMDNGLPFQAANQVDLSPLGVTSESFTACLASRAIPEKGWLEAIEATQKARNITQTDIHLLLIGDGPMYDLLKSRDLPDFIHLLGFKSNVGDYLVSVQLGLVPSYFKGESFPFIMIEFFIAGIPVIASNIGEISRMLKADNNKIGGSLIELHNGKVDSSELADAMIKMVIDKEFYNDCVNTVSLLKPRFDIDNIAQQYLAVYKRTLS